MHALRDGSFGEMWVGGRRPREFEHVFAGTWICIGRAATFAEPGDRRAYQVGREGILVVRGTDGRLRGDELTFTAGGTQHTGKVAGNSIQGSRWTATKK